MSESQNVNKLKFYLSILKYSILDPYTGLGIFQDNLAQFNDRRKKQYLKFNELKTQVPDVIKQLFPEENSSQIQSNNLFLLQNDLKKFLDSKKNSHFPSKELPYPLNSGLDDTSCLLLYCICKIMKPEIIVETGVAFGKSTSYILQALDENNKGTLYSIDPVTRSWQSVEMIGSMIPNRLKNRWKLIEGKSSKRLEPLLNSLGSIDIFYHDSFHTYKNMMYEFMTSWSFIKKNGILIVDDVNYNDSLYDFCDQFNQIPVIFSKQNDKPKLGFVLKSKL